MLKFVCAYMEVDVMMYLFALHAMLMDGFIPICDATFVCILYACVNGELNFLHAESHPAHV